MGDRLNEIYTDLNNIKIYLTKLNPDRRISEPVIKRKQEASDLYKEAETCITVITDKFKKKGVR